MNKKTGHVTSSSTRPFDST